MDNMDLSRALDAFQLDSLETLHALSLDGLKRAFKARMTAAHPDRGGTATEFETITEAYVFLRHLRARSTGGREHAGVIHVTNVIEQREEQYRTELNNMVYDLCVELESPSSTEFLARFNEQFEKQRASGEHIDALERGTVEESKEMDEPIHAKAYEADVAIPIDTSLTVDNFHARFVEHATKGKTCPSTLILHPNEMAANRYGSCGMGMGGPKGRELIPTDTGDDQYQMLGRLHASAVMDVYDIEGTIIDKLPPAKSVEHRTFEQLLEERNMIYQTELDRDLEAIAAYERAEQERQTQHAKKIAELYRTTGSSTWALPSIHVDTTNTVLLEPPTYAKQESEFRNAIKPDPSSSCCLS